jgi:hypothetical protein
VLAYSRNTDKGNYVFLSGISKMNKIVTSIILPSGAVLDCTSKIETLLQFVLDVRSSRAKLSEDQELTLKLWILKQASNLRQNEEVAVSRQERPELTVSAGRRADDTIYFDDSLDVYEASAHQFFWL